MKNLLSTIACLGLVFATGMITTSAQADSCNSPQTCARVLTCYRGFSETMTRSGMVCQVKKDADSHTPTCGKFKMRNDWKWSAKDKECQREKKRTTVSSTENIECRSGYSYNKKNGKCERPAETISAMPVLSKSENPVGTPKTCSSATSCAKKVTCSSGADREKLGDAYYCKSVRKAATATPTCSKFRKKRDWKWNPESKKCERERKRTTVSATKNITCESAYDYNASSGLCEMPAGTFFSKPILD